ncbi:MAG TPA: energy transducer TonB [Bacteroidia bacterium]|jgi:protein TonB|nr:energy transducer TonB [Bacteroidia bacterium]
MKKYLSLFFFFGIINYVFSQMKHDTSALGSFTVVQQQPTFPGNLNEYLKSHIIYPDTEKNELITGTVFLQLTIEADGTISGIAILKNVPSGPGLTREAIRVVKAMPKWQPGIQGGKKIKMTYNLPIQFRLDSLLVIPEK